MNVQHVDALAIGRRIAEVRALSGMRVAAFARAVGLEPKTIGRLEEGSNVPSLPSLTTIAHVFDVRLEWLVNGAGPMGPRDPGDSVSTDTP